jgi:hypothetical protein
LSPLAVTGPGVGQRREFVLFFRLVEVGLATTDADPVRAMRARLMMKVVGLVIMLVLSVVTARSCSSSPSSSDLNPSTLEQNGLSGLCANQAAVAGAGGEDTPQTLQIPAEQGNLANLAGAAGLAPGTFSCPTTTIAGVSR